MNRSLVINFVGQLRIEVAKGIVGEPGKMKYRIKTIQVDWRNVPDIFANRAELTQAPCVRALLSTRRAVCFTANSNGSLVNTLTCIALTASERPNIREFL